MDIIVYTIARLVMGDSTDLAYKEIVVFFIASVVDISFIIEIQGKQELQYKHI